MPTRQSTYPAHLVGRSAAPPTHPDPAEYRAARAEQRRNTPQLGDPPAVFGANWRMAGSLVVLLDEANAVNPDRDRASDGGIGDPAHAAQGEASDHNPWLIVAGTGVVRARDFDVDGLDIPGSFERARLAAAQGLMPQLIDGGYLIHNRRITAEDFTGWRTYRGPNPHILHGHVSVSRDPARFDDRRPWTIFGEPQARHAAPEPHPAPPAPTPPPRPAAESSYPLNSRMLEIGADNYPEGDPRHDLTRRVQAVLRTRFPLYAKRLQVDGWYGPATRAAVTEFQRRSPGLAADGVAGPMTLRRLGL